MAQYNTLFDQTQIAFYALATGQTNPADALKVAGVWSQILQTSLATITAASADFRSFIAQGSQHCIITSNDFYTKEESGNKLLDWFTDYLSGEPISNVFPELP